ncbi:MAG: caspase family protein [Deltaproteobacteria bacterium]|nr:caspase family protein [Deltaproteobacteria bacterium]
MKQLLLATLLGLAWNATARAEPRRFALVVGANGGDADELPLRYATADAQRVRDALVDVGGVRAEDVRLLADPSADEVIAALGQLEAKLRAHATPGDQLVVYASGHADSGALHLGGSRLPLHTLTEFMRQVPASVALLILDSCRSGSATHVKGLEPIEGTRVNVELPDVNGRVIIGSSGPEEYAQESDALQGSFFTHHLLAGLRGAADASHDGVVTLQEAYSYAYALTVESTFGTRGGVQHPSYSVDLHGEGDLVLSEPVHARGKLRLAVAAPGEWLVYTAGSRSIVGQFEKPEGETLLAVAPGTYRVLERTGTGYLEQVVTVPEGGEALIHEDALGPSSFVPTNSKGGATTISLALGGSVGSAATSDVPMTGGVAIWGAYEHPLGLRLAVIDADLAVRTATASRNLSYREESLELRVGPGVQMRRGPLTLSVALMAGEAMVREADLAGDSGAPSFAPELGLSPRLRLTIMRPVELAIAGFAGAEDVRTDEGRFVRFRGDLQLGVGFAL